MLCAPDRNSAIQAADVVDREALRQSLLHECHARSDLVERLRRHITGTSPVLEPSRLNTPPLEVLSGGVLFSERTSQ